MVFKKDNVPWNKGKNLSNETKQKISENHKKSYKNGLINPMFGKHHSEKVKEKISDANKGHHRNKGIPKTEEHKKKISEAMKGNKNAFGYSPSEEHKRKISDAKKGYIPWNKGKTGSQTAWNKGKYGVCSSETLEKMRLKRLQRIFPQKDTILELKLQNALTERGISFTKHKPITGQPDIFIEPNICIFADGCYWHACEQCYDRNKMSNWILARKTADMMITGKLRQNNYIVLRFWEHEINKGADGCILKTINESLRPVFNFR